MRNVFQKLKSVATSTGQNMKTGSQSLSTTNPPMLKNEVKNNVFFNIYFTQVFFLKNIYVKQFFFWNSGKCYEWNNIWWKCGEIRFEVGSKSRGIASFQMCFSLKKSTNKILTSKFKVLLIKKNNPMSMKYRCTIDCMFLILGQRNTRYSRGRRVGGGNESQH